MSNIGFRVTYDFDRPEKRLIEGLRNLPVANIDDCMNRISAVDSSIKPMNKEPLIGCAFTVKCPAGDNLMFHKALDLAKEGDIIVVAAGGGIERSLCGEIMVAYAKSKGIAGFLVDGCIRDVDAIAKIDFPVYAKGVTPNGPYKNGPGEINVPVSFAGQVICPGDIIIGDGDGVIIIKPEEAEELIKKTVEKNNQEIQTFKDIDKGVYDRRWVDKTLKNLGCQF